MVQQNSSSSDVKGVKKYIIHEFDRQGDSNDDWSQLGELEAANMDDAIKQVKEYWLSEDFMKDATYDELDLYPFHEFMNTQYYDNDGNEIGIPEEFDEDKHNWREFGVQLEEIEEDNQE